MRVFIPVCLAALFIWAAVLGLWTNAGGSAVTTDVLSVPSKLASAGEVQTLGFIELHNNAHLEGLSIQSIPDLLRK
jgi:hypothetical protein